MGQEFSVVGKRLPLVEAVEKATGTARYTVDIKLPGMLIAKVLRSPYPHARILKVDASKAEKLPGVAAIITQDDVKPRRPFSYSHQELPLKYGVTPKAYIDQYIFDDKVRFVGDAIAAVAAVDENTAEEALSLIDVQYEVLPAVLDATDAMKPGAPLVHDSARGNIAWHITYPFPEGDVEQGFRESDCVVEGTFRTPKQLHQLMEPGATVASFDASGRLTVWTQVQEPHVARRELAHIMDMPVGMVKMVTGYTGGSFGSRLGLNPEYICTSLAKKARKPVKLEYTKEEENVVYGTRTGFIINGKMGFKRDGTIHAMQMRLITNIGSYVGRGPGATAHCLIIGLGHYRCPNRAGEADLVYSNIPMSGAMRGFGGQEAMWVIEQLVDMAAEKLGLDPLEIRLKNTKKPGDIGSLGLTIQSLALDECIKVGAEQFGWKEKRARKKDNGTKRRGVGMATMSWITGGVGFILEHSNAFIKLNEDGSASLIVAPGEPGTGIAGALAQIAAEELGIRAEDVHVTGRDTDITMFDIGSAADRSTYTIGNAVLRAAREARGQLLTMAAKLLAVSPEELEAKDRRVYVRADPGKGISVGEVAHTAIYNLDGEPFNISGKGTFSAKTASPPSQACFAEVEVDTETGEVKVLRMVVANDSGRAINPTTVEGQLQGGVIQGIGYTLTEEFVIDRNTGALLSNNLTTYKVPSVFETPDIETILVEKPDPVGPFGAKGAGEPGSITTGPAIANAVYDAVGVRVNDPPMTPEKVLQARL